MTHKTLARLIKAVILAAVAIVIAVYAFSVPALAFSMAEACPEFAGWMNKWLIFVAMTALPILVSAYQGWRVACSIGIDRSFTHDNARRIRIVSILAAADAGYFLLGNIVMLFLSMNHPGIVLISALISVVGFGISAAFAALSYLTEKAALMQDDTDLTI